MKKLLSLLLIISSLVFTNLVMLDNTNFKLDDFISSEEFLSEVRELSQIDDYIDNLPFFKEEIKDIIDKIQQSEVIQDLSIKYSQMIIEDVIFDTNSFNQEEFSKNVLISLEESNNLIDNQLIKSIFELIKPFIKKNLDNLDLKDNYQQIINKQREELGKEKLLFFKLLTIIKDNMQQAQIISGAVFIVSFLLLMILKAEGAKKALLSTLIMTSLNHLILTYYFKDTEVVLFNNIFYITYIGVFILLIISSLIFKKKV